MSFLDKINDISLFFWFISIFITIYSIHPYSENQLLLHITINQLNKKIHNIKLALLKTQTITTNDDILKHKIKLKQLKLFCILISGFFLSFPANAKTNSFDTNDGSFLIKSCREAIEIFENKSEKRF